MINVRLSKVLFFATLLAVTTAGAKADCNGSGPSSGKFKNETKQAKDLVAATSIVASYNYCVQGTLTCRTLVQLKDKVTGRTVPSFYDVFVSSERAVGSTGYFMQNQDGTFKASLDDVFDGQIDITTVYPENARLVVTYDSDYFPTVHDLILKRLGTTRYVVADLTFDAYKATIIGVEKDSANPSYNQPVSITYAREFGKLPQ